MSPVPWVISQPRAARIGVGVDGALTRFVGGGRVAGGGFKIGEDAPGVPRHGVGAEPGLAFDGTLKFAAGFVVAAELDKGGREVVAVLPLHPDVP